MTANPNHVEYAKLTKRIIVLENQNAELIDGIAGIQATLTATLEKVDAIGGQVSPAIEALSNSPMLKMLTGGK